MKDAPIPGPCVYCTLQHYIKLHYIALHYNRLRYIACSLFVSGGCSNLTFCLNRKAFTCSKTLLAGALELIREEAGGRGAVDELLIARWLVQGMA